MKKLIGLLLLLIPIALFSQNIDIKTLRAINSPETLPYDGFFKVVSNSNIYVITGVPVTMAIVGLAGHDDELLRNACVMAAGTAITYGIALGLKYTIKRDRPFITYPDIINKSGHPYTEEPSFPSGHASTAFATATALSLEYPKWYVIAPSYVYAGTVAYSRMELGVHYPSDVLVGALIGSGCAYLSYVVNNKLNSNSNKHNR
jgi:membrane-associated phospholipid phosphatase